MPVADLIKKFRTKTREASKSAKELAIDLVAGSEHDDAEIEAACKAAGWSFEQFAGLLTALETRKRDFEEFTANDRDAKVERLKASYRQVQADAAAVTAEIEALQAEATRLHQLGEALPREIQKADLDAREFTRAFQEKYGDAETWQDDPQPRPHGRRVPDGEKINVGWKPQPGSLAAGKTPEGHDTTSKRVDFGPAIDIGLKAADTE
jgi:chromosome segregation ATPase